MESYTFILQLVIILVAAKAFGEIASKLQIPAVIGELFAGILIGPSLLHWVEASDPVKLLAEIGVILLLFEVGLETDIGRLVHAGPKAALVAFGGVIAPFILGYSLAFYLFNFSMLASLFVGSTLTATSIGITVRVFKDLGEQNSHESQIILGAAVIDDVIGIILLSMLYEFSTYGNVDLWNAFKIMVFITIYFLLAPILVKSISSMINLWGHSSKLPGLLPAMIVSLILFFSWAAHLVGAPELLGGFVTGLALSKNFIMPFSFLRFKNDKDFTHHIHEQMQPIIYLFAPIFFVTIGLSINLKEINYDSLFIWILSISLILLAIITKMAAGFLSYRESLRSKLIIGIAMVPRGEVGLIFAGIALASNVFSNEIYASIVLVIIMTTILPPFFLRLFYKSSKEN